jgi:hypothetical protein
MEYPARFNQAALDFWDEVERPLPRSFHGFSRPRIIGNQKLAVFGNRGLGSQCYHQQHFYFGSGGTKMKKLFLGWAALATTGVNGRKQRPLAKSKFPLTRL